MTILQEGNLQIELPEHANGRQFDGPEHGLSHCMKAVDWIVELRDFIYFIEVKDLDSMGARAHSDKNRFLQELERGRRDSGFIGKFRDSFLHEWASDKIDRPIIYLVVIACSALDKAMLLNRTNALQRNLPAGLPVGWNKPLAEACLVFNIETWNDKFPEFPLARTNG